MPWELENESDMKSMTILVESGATKSSWHLLNGDGIVVRQFMRPGMNVSTMKMEDILNIISEAFSSENLGSIPGQFCLYTAGVVTPEVRITIEKKVKAVSAVGSVDVQDDLVGAARAVCGREPGIAAILGTGSNACYYDGVTAIRNVYSGGFILGDEGSGAALGRLFLADFIKDLVPERVAEDFRSEFDSSYSAIVEGVYHSVSPSGYLGSFAPFILRHKDDPYVLNLLESNFQAFIDRILLKYDTVSYPVGVVGGFAWACRDILLPMLEKKGIRVTRILKAPIEALCEYHTK